MQNDNFLNTYHFLVDTLQKHAIFLLTSRNGLFGMIFVCTSQKIYK